MNKIITILLVFISCTAFGQGATPNLRSGFELYYRFERTSGNVIDEIQNNDGTNNGAARGVTGIKGNAFDFEASDPDIVYAALTSSYANFTFSCWINLEGWGVTAGGLGRILSKNNGAFEKFLYVNDNGYLAFGQGFTTQFGQWRTPPSAISLTGWFHVVVTYDNTSTTNDPVIYINNTSQTITELDTPSGTASTNTNQYTIGNREVDEARGFDGEIDEVLIYNRILTQLEVNQHCNSGNGLLYVYENFKNGYISFSEYLAYYLEYLKYNQS